MPPSAGQALKAAALILQGADPQTLRPQLDVVCSACQEVSNLLLLAMLPKHVIARVLELHERHADGSEGPIADAAARGGFDDLKQGFTSRQPTVRDCRNSGV